MAMSVPHWRWYARGSRTWPPSGIALRRRARLALTDADAQEAPRPRPHGLTPREAEVLLLLGQGSTNRQIARQLFIAEKTVSIHLSRILTKLAVPNRSAAAAAAFHLGLIEP